MEEIWKDIPGYEDYYQVSNLGNARSLDRIVNKAFGTRRAPGKTLAKHMSRGYVRTHLQKDGSGKLYQTHALVLLAFVGPRPEGMDINHIDGNKTNNSVNNLEYVTRKQNIEHSIYVLGNDFRGERSSNSKLTKNIVKEARQMRLNGAAYRGIIEMIQSRHAISISRITLRRIVAGETWTHV